MKLATIKNKALKSTIDFGDGETLNLVYNPSNFTPRFFESITHEDGKNTVSDLAVFISSLVTEWDLVDDSGAVVPLTMDSLCCLPIEFLGKVVDRINADQNPNPPSSTASSFS